ncbi:hypothetical protein N7456_004375, partial [Penicillium angulare]
GSFQVIVGIWAAITGPFRGERGGTTVFKHVVISMTRMFFDHASIEQLRYVQTSTLRTWRYLFPSKGAENAYRTLMHSRNLKPNIIELDNNTKAFWFGDPEAEKLIIYIPGGAYCIPALPAHFDFVDALQRNLEKHGQRSGVLFLSYDLAPRYKWPRQLEQAVSLLRYATETLGKRSSNIIIQGDSAGGHLALALLSHLAQPHPQSSVPRLSLGEDIRGVLLLSPWIDFGTDWKSFHTNASKDSLSVRGLCLNAEQIFSNEKKDSYSHPLNAPAGWWKSLPVKRIFVGVGGDEILLDSIVALVQNIE